MQSPCVCVCAGSAGAGGSGGAAGGCETSAGCASRSCCSNPFATDNCCWKNEGANQCASLSSAGGAGVAGGAPSAAHTGAPGSGAFTAAGYAPSDGGAGRRGQPGGGGGGGGGGHGGADNCDSYGGGGAGGGGGGCGGFGGYAAKGGGASIALYAFNSSLVLAGVHLVTAIGGDCGLGGVGGAGGSGGVGGYYAADQSNAGDTQCKGSPYGGSGSQDDAGNGGIGGSGGRGGQGGRGGDGAPGPAIALAVYDSSAVRLFDVTYAVSAAGALCTAALSCAFSPYAGQCGGLGAHTTYDARNRVRLMYCVVLCAAVTHFLNPVVWWCCFCFVFCCRYQLV